MLGVAAGASTEDIRRAYLQLARANHPDYFVDAPGAERLAAEQRMRSINEAWAVLRDPRRRRGLEDGQPRGFRPFAPEADDPDPRDAPDIPYRSVRPTRRDRILTPAPVVLFAASVVVGSVAVLMGHTGVLAVAVALFLLSCVGFVVMPLVALTRARRDEG